MTARFPLLGLFTCMFGLLGLEAQTAPNDEARRVVEDASKIKVEQKADEKLPTVWIIGDSTVKVSTAGQRGWGEEIRPHFDLGKVNIVNRAIGGRSSRTFITEGRWEAIVNELKAGDVVIMQFGHNDASPVNEKVLDKSTRARGTIKGIGEETEEVDNILTKKHEVVHTFGWYMRKYVNEAKAKGVRTVICSPIPRNTWDKEGKVVNRNNTGYGLWARQVAEQTGADFIDLNDLIASRWEKMGKEAVAPLFHGDSTHTSPEGAKLNAACVVTGLRALKDNPVAAFLKPSE